MTFHWRPDASSSWKRLLREQESGGEPDAAAASISENSVKLNWFMAVTVFSIFYPAMLSAWLTQDRLQGRIETIADLINSNFQYGQSQCYPKCYPP